MSADCTLAQGLFFSSGQNIELEGPSEKMQNHRRQGYAGESGNVLLINTHCVPVFNIISKHSSQA
jgi:uncharacterized protein YigE (DUF2233 family)